ncbi:unnamed protein product [Peniophora sp. CBMAI 1063]|nr:unnamed protein product [Peniophora sp. CBMAI 1063]
MPGHQASSESPYIMHVNDDVLKEIIVACMESADTYYGAGPPDEFKDFLSLRLNLRDRKRNLYTMIRVCRRFRDVAYANADIWASIAGASGSERGFNRLVERARRAPLTLVHSRERTLSDTQIDYAVKNLDRIARLSVETNESCDWAEILSGKSMASLSALSVSSFSRYTVSTRQYALPPLDAPQLRHLVFSDSFFIPVMAPRLRKLKLSGIRVIFMEPAHLLDLLSSTPFLQDLSLSDVIPSAITKKEQWEPCLGHVAVLPMLEVLKVHADCCATIITLLEHVKLPDALDARITFTATECDADVLALGRSLQHCLVNPVFDTVLIRIEARFVSTFEVYSNRDLGTVDTPGISLGLNDDKKLLEHVATLAEFILPHRIEHLDLRQTCESSVYNTDAMARALKWIAPSVQTISIEVVDGIVLDFLTDEGSPLDFSALREIKMKWPEQSEPQRGPDHWDGFRAWMKRTGAKQLQTLTLEGVSHHIDRWCLEHVQAILKEHDSKCTVVDKRITYGARINYEPITGGREIWDWST